MNPAEYDRIAALEDTHWWYAGIRDLFQRILESDRFRIPPGGNVLDAGCGCGANLKLLSNVTSPAYLGGFDLSDLAVQYAARKNPGADVYLADLCEPVTHVDELDLILCCDVLYTTPLEAGVAGLASLVRKLKPGGLFLLHLPAYEWLKSSHDLAVHTRQRFTTQSARNIVTELGLRAELLSYRMCLLFPAVVVSRLPSLLRRGSGSDTDQSDLQPVRASLNNGLRTALRLENRMLARGLRLPWGSSIVAVARKP
ncbi:MAG TPA: class I SAM-dependent methyltransferase [Caulifigura sp.]|jgi:SAM-dependent methyltransferase|nr:class I SAM-dependent methyltransferase [Caulifigura sp.]